MTTFAPRSDTSGCVLTVGPKITRFQAGATVNTLFNQAHHYGPLTPAAVATAFGDELDGTLRQYVVLDTLTSACVVGGLMVGSRDRIEATNQAIEMNNIRSIVDENRTPTDTCGISDILVK